MWSSAHFKVYPKVLHAREEPLYLGATIADRIIISRERPYQTEGAQWQPDGH
jgi:hypothetical protein